MASVRVPNCRRSEHGNRAHISINVYGEFPARVSTKLVDVSLEKGVRPLLRRESFTFVYERTTQGTKPTRRLVGRAVITRSQTLPEGDSTPSTHRDSRRVVYLKPRTPQTVVRQTKRVEFKSQDELAAGG